MATELPATITVKQTDDGWYVVVTNSENVVVRTSGPRITVASTPDDDSGNPEEPLSVTLGPVSVP